MLRARYRAAAEGRSLTLSFATQQSALFPKLRWRDDARHFLTTSHLATKDHYPLGVRTLPSLKTPMYHLSVCHFHSSSALLCSDRDDKDDKAEEENKDNDKAKEEDKKPKEEDKKEEPLTPFDEASEIEGFDPIEEEDDNNDNNEIEEEEEVPSIEEKISLNDEDLNPLICKCAQQLLPYPSYIY